MTSQEERGNVTREKKSRRQLKWQQYTREILDFILGFRNAMIIIVTWIFVSEIAGYSVLDLFGSILSLFLYPVNLLLFNTDFSDINVPEVFFILVPLIALITIGFLIIVSTED
ncbi:MAG: hypothetical protein ACFFAE_13730 [Candidatus Hodarchaeota archaeon]